MKKYQHILETGQKCMKLYDNMIKSGATDEDLRLAKEEGAFYENERTPDCKEFVMHGSSVAGVGTRCKK